MTSMGIILNIVFAAIGITASILSAIYLFKSNRRLLGGILVAFLWGVFQVFFNYLACA